MSLEDGHRMLSNSRSNPKGLWLKMRIMFPNLENLFFILKPNLSRSYIAVGDLMEIVVDYDKTGLPIGISGESGKCISKEQALFMCEILVSHAMMRYTPEICDTYNTFSIAFIELRS